MPIGKLNIAISAIVLMALVVAYLSFFGIQMVSVDKQRYSSGETVVARLTDISMEWCTPMRGGVRVERYESGAWKDIMYGVGGFGCIDGVAPPVAMPADVITCGMPHLSTYSGSFRWDLKEMVYQGEVSSCVLQITGETINSSMPGYHEIDAQPGSYRLRFGGAQAPFTVG